MLLVHRLAEEESKYILKIYWKLFLNKLRISNLCLVCSKMPHNGVLNRYATSIFDEIEICFY